MNWCDCCNSSPLASKFSSCLKLWRQMIQSTTVYECLRLLCYCKDCARRIDLYISEATVSYVCIHREWSCNGAVGPFVGDGGVSCIMNDRRWGQHGTRPSTRRRSPGQPINSRGATSVGNNITPLNIAHSRRQRPTLITEENLSPSPSLPLVFCDQ